MFNDDVQGRSSTRLFSGRRWVSLLRYIVSPNMIWAWVVLVISIGLLFLPKELLTELNVSTPCDVWLYQIEEDFATSQNRQLNPEQEYRSQHTLMSEAVTVASYSTVIILTLISFTVPLLILYFNQIIDGMQSLMIAGFEELRLCQRQGNDVITGVCSSEGLLKSKNDALEALYRKCFEFLEDTSRVGVFLRPAFYAIFGTSLFSLLIVIALHVFVVQSLFSTCLLVREFYVSVWLGFNSILGLLFLASGGFSLRRIELLKSLHSNVCMSLNDTNGHFTPTANVGKTVRQLEGTDPIEKNYKVNRTDKQAPARPPAPNRPAATGTTVAIGAVVTAFCLSLFFKTSKKQKRGTSAKTRRDGSQ